MIHNISRTWDSFPDTSDIDIEAGSIIWHLLGPDSPLRVVLQLMDLGILGCSGQWRQDSWNLGLDRVDALLSVDLKSNIA